MHIWRILREKKMNRNWRTNRTGSTKAFEKTIVDICPDICLSLWAMAEKSKSLFISISGTPWHMRIILDTTKNKKFKKKNRSRNLNSAPYGPRHALMNILTFLTDFRDLVQYPK